MVAIVLFEVEVKFIFDVGPFGLEGLPSSGVLSHLAVLESDVLDQLVLPVVLRFALCAFISPKITLNFPRLILLVFLMSARVIPHVADALEALPANLACVGSFSAVGAHVNFEVSFLEEGLLTYRA